MTDPERPADILGEAVFTSYDGLRAEGCGILAGVSRAPELFEMRDAEIFRALPGYDMHEATFIQLAWAGEDGFLLYGTIIRVRDFNNRKGIFGVAYAVREEPAIFEEVFRSRLGNFHDEAYSRFQERLSGRPLPDRLGLFAEHGTEDAYPSIETTNETRIYRTNGSNGVNLHRFLADVSFLLDEPVRVLLTPLEDTGFPVLDADLVEQTERLRREREAEDRERADAELRDRIDQLSELADRVYQLEMSTGGALPASDDQDRRGRERDFEGRWNMFEEDLETLKERVRKLEEWAAQRARYQDPVPSPTRRVHIDDAFEDEYEELSRRRIIILGVLGAGLFLAILAVGITFAVWSFSSSGSLDRATIEILTNEAGPEVSDVVLPAADPVQSPDCSRAPSLAEKTRCEDGVLSPE